MLQWESKVSQYERDFERVSATVRKEVLRFEVSTLGLSMCFYIVDNNRAVFCKHARLRSPALRCFIIIFSLQQKEQARDFKKQIVRYLDSLLNSQQQVKQLNLPPPYALIHTVKSDTMNKHSLSVSLSHVADQVLGGVLARGKSNCMMAAYTNKHTHAYTGLLKTESAFSILFTSCL